MNAADFERLGVYDPAAPDAEDNLKVLEYVVGLGATEEELVQFHRGTGSFGDLALDLILRPPGRMLRLDEATTEVGLDLEEAARFIRALGFPDPRESGILLPERYVEQLAQILSGARQLLGPDTVLAIARVMGSTSYRLAEALVDALRTNFEVPLHKSGVPYSEVVLRYGELTQTLLPVFLDAFTSTFKGHLVQISSGGWSFDEEDGVTRKDLSVGFVDMVGYSSLSRGISSGRLAELVVRFEDVVSEILAQHEGRIVKLVGDGAMFVSPDPADACRAALELIDRFDDDEALPPVHIGLAFGPLVTLNGDYFGDAVNVAGRLHDLAPASKVLVDEGIAKVVAGAFKVEDVSVWMQRTDVEGPIYELRGAS